MFRKKILVLMLAVAVVFTGLPPTSQAASNSIGQAISIIGALGSLFGGGGSSSNANSSLPDPFLNSKSVFMGRLEGTVQPEYMAYENIHSTTLDGDKIAFTPTKAGVDMIDLDTNKVLLSFNTVVRYSRSGCDLRISQLDSASLNKTFYFLEYAFEFSTINVFVVGKVDNKYKVLLTEKDFVNNGCTSYKKNGGLIGIKSLNDSIVAIGMHSTLRLGSDSPPANTYVEDYLARFTWDEKKQKLGLSRIK